jgi:titin
MNHLFRPSKWRFLILGRRRRGSVTLYPPNTPLNLTLLASPFDLSLEWEYTTNVEEGFRVYRSSYGDPFVLVAEVAAGQLSYADGSVEMGTIYTYYVVASNAAGESVPASNEVYGETEAGA